MRRWRDALFAVLLASVVIPTLPRLTELLRLARRVRPMSMHQRREILLGDFYRGVEALPEGSEPLALIAAVPGSLDGLFINYYLYPRPTRIYRDRWQYVTSNPKERPKQIVSFGDGSPRIVSYAALRNAELQKSMVVQPINLPAERRTSFAIPMVTSADGGAGDSYTIEGALASDEEAHVTLTLYPAGTVKTLTIRGAQTFYDLVYQCFGVMEFVAWVQVSSDRPIRAAFWLVNRRPKTAAPLRLVDRPLDKPVPFPVDPKPLLWLLNLSDEVTLAHAGPNDALLSPRSLIGIHATGTVSGRVYAFLAAKEPNGGTLFTWPEDVK